MFSRISEIESEDEVEDRFTDIVFEEDGTTPKNISFGVILISRDEKGKFYVLINQRRHTYDYCSSIIGDSRIRQKGYRGVSCSKMTKKEKIAMIDPKKDFEAIWLDMWGSARTTRLKLEAAKHFKILKSPKVFYLVSTIKKSKPDLPWGFPKGKPSSYDGGSRINTAIREFIEETKIRISDKHIISTTPIKDEFLGTDGRIYVSEYFVAFSLNRPRPCKMINMMTFDKLQVCGESLDVKWIPEDKIDLYISTSYSIAFQRAKMIFQRAFPEAVSRVGLFESSLLYGPSLVEPLDRPISSTRLSLTPMPKSFGEFHPSFFSEESSSSASSSESTASEEPPASRSLFRAPFPGYPRRPYPFRSLGESRTISRL